MSSYNTLLTAVTKSFHDNTSTAASCETTLFGLGVWIKQIADAQLTSAGGQLLHASLSANVEIVAAVRLGMIKQAVYSARNLYELLFAWLYYKDHPIEWEQVQTDVDQMMLPGEARKYLRKLPHFEARWSCLGACKARKIAEPYDVMSAIVHGRSSAAMPNASKPEDLVASKYIVISVVEFLSDLVEYLFDVLVSSYANNWESLPIMTQKSLEQRLSSEACSKLQFS